MNFQKVVNTILFLIIIVSILLSGYLFFFRKIDITKETQSYQRVLSDDLSTIEAEKLNYDNVEKKEGVILEQKEYNELASTTSENHFPLKQLIDINQNLLKYQGELLAGYTPVIYNSTSESYDHSEISTQLKSLVNEYRIQEIVLAPTMQNDLEQYYSLLEDLNSIDELKVSAILNPRSSESESYANYKLFNPTITKIVDIQKINNLLDYAYIAAYDYTPINAALPGPNSKLTDAEDIIQYYIAKGLDKAKIFLGINKVPFEWTDRTIATSIKDNMLVSVIQAKIFSKDILLLSNVIQNSNSDNIGEFLNTEDNKIYLIVYPSDKYINNLKTLALNYGLKGIFFRY